MHATLLGCMKCMFSTSPSFGRCYDYSTPCSLPEIEIAAGTVCAGGAAFSETGDFVGRPFSAQ